MYCERNLVVLWFENNTHDVLYKPQYNILDAQINKYMFFEDVPMKSQIAEGFDFFAYNSYDTNFIRVSLIASGQSRKGGV